VDSLPKGSVFYRVSAESDVERANSYLPKDYREKRDRKSLERYVIMSAKTAASKTPRLERELAVVPEGTDGFDQDVSMTVYGDKVAFIDFANESSIVIENPLIAEFQKQLFLLAYRNLKNR
jgi:hypothetical protein